VFDFFASGTSDGGGGGSRGFNGVVLPWESRLPVGGCQHTSSNDATYVVTKLFLYTYFPSQIPYRLSLGVKEVSTLRIKVKIIFVLKKNIKKLELFKP